MQTKRVSFIVKKQVPVFLELTFCYKKNVADRKKIKMKITNTSVGYLKHKCPC